MSIMTSKKIFRFSFFSLLSIAFLSFAQDDESKKIPSNDSTESKGVLPGLTDTERTKLREAMKDVWTDPAVVQSREAINESVKAYKASIRTALLKKDPSLEPALIKMEKDSSGHVRQMMGGPPRGPGSHRFDGKGKSSNSPEISPFDRFTRYPPFLNDLPENKKNNYFKVRDQIRDSTEIKSILKRLEDFNEQDKRNRIERTSLYSELRKTIHKKMIEIDPSLSEILSKDDSEQRGGKKKGQKDDPDQ